MANCLILLARGGHGNNDKTSIQHPEEEEDVVIPTVTTATTTTNLMEVAVPRFNSRRITEASIIGKSGFYVYECKTCNRCFPSFQALGGHRASHKKPKNLLMVEDHQQQQLKKSLVKRGELFILFPNDDFIFQVNPVVIRNFKNVLFCGTDKTGKCMRIIITAGLSLGMIPSAIQV
ncbi:hypothetical protein C5167_001830 [Papaver somniferum]|uniref:C2H2-type domain-containing protein n=1 Tax=Papaver somniferum TaxID=3469 RepID=A0A4Y7KY94_PAPSO|nr:hypothetical protein C5167_001830 [Papaver somniferum]